MIKEIKQYTKEYIRRKIIVTSALIAADIIYKGGYMAFGLIKTKYKNRKGMQ